MVAIVPGSEVSWQEYKVLRLETLKNESLGFAEGYEEALQRFDEAWQQGLANMYFAQVDGVSAGMVMLVQATNFKRTYCGFVYSMYVRPQFRGMGVGKTLIQYLQTVAAPQKGIKKLELNVTETQQAALGLYKVLGFSVSGRQTKNICVDGIYYDQIMMEWFDPEFKASFENKEK